MDTPGGLSDSMKDSSSTSWLRRFRCRLRFSYGSSRSFRRFFILLSADIAPWAGHAHRRSLADYWSRRYPVAIDETLRRKIMNDGRLFCAARREALPQPEARGDRRYGCQASPKRGVDGKLIDIIANSEDDLLRQLNGREITRSTARKQSSRWQIPFGCPLNSRRARNFFRASSSLTSSLFF